MADAGDDMVRGVLISAAVNYLPLPRAWSAHEEPVDVTVAEMDPEVTRIAAEQFCSTAIRQTVIHADARRVLMRSDVTL